MKIAVCDDSEQDLANILSLLSAYKKVTTDGIEHKGFSSAIDLLDALQHEQYDLIFLDIMMPRVNGIDAAKEIRNTDIKTIIVFLTSSPEYAIQGYSVMAYSYLLKPCDEATLFPLLTTLIVASTHKDDFFVVKSKHGISKIMFTQLVYAEVLRRTVVFHLANKTMVETVAPLGEYDDILLSRHEFCRTHRSYIVNLHYVTTLTGTAVITLSNKDIPVSRRLYALVKQRYVKQLFVESV